MLNAWAIFYKVLKSLAIIAHKILTTWVIVFNTIAVYLSEVQKQKHTVVVGQHAIGIKDIFECFMMVLNYRAAEY